MIIPEAWLVRWQGMPTDPVALWGGPPVFLITAPVTVWAVRQAWRAWRQRRLLKEGRWRQGLFILPGALLFNHGHHCTLVPRSKAVGLATDSNHDQEDGPSTAAYIVYRDHAGGLHSELLPTVEARARVKTWLTTGQYLA